MKRESLERYQIVVYLAAVMAGVAAALLGTDMAERLELLVWPVLAVLLYATFCQVSLGEAARSFRHRRFFVASLLANFVLVPIIVWSLSWLLPRDPAIRLGVFVVLLVPCTDWFVTFTHLGKGATRLAVALLPVQLLAQLVLLPVYLWIFMGRDFVRAVALDPFLQVFTWIVLVPFVMATLTRYRASHHSSGAGWLRATAWLPVPMLGLVLFLVTASQGRAVSNGFIALGWAALVFALYLVIAAPLARVVALVFRMEAEAGRTLAFNVGTRNSFVVLPLALALPAGWEMAVAAIVLQTLIELSGMIGYLWLIPNRVFPAERLEPR